MKSSSDQSIDELFIGYWDNSLSPYEAEKLARELASDSAVRGAFELFCLSAVFASDLPISTPSTTTRGLSRRRVLQAAVGGLAVSLIGVAIHRFVPPDPAPALQRSIRLISSSNDVILWGPEGDELPRNGPVPDGSRVATVGAATFAALYYFNGTSVVLGGDTSVTLHPSGDRIAVERGVISADVRLPHLGGKAFTLETSDAFLSELSEVIMTLDHLPNSTEVSVHQGQVLVSAPDGRQLEQVARGELLTVQPNGDCSKQSIPEISTSFSWDLRRELPSGWSVGQREVTTTGPIIRPVLYFDPYHSADMYQIRSDKQWSRGFFQLTENSTIRVRYRVERSGQGEICFCVRTRESRCSDTGMLGWNGQFIATRPGEWQCLEFRAGDMLGNKHALQFGAPWIGFLVIFNTFQADLGLNVSEFRVQGTSMG